MKATFDNALMGLKSTGASTGIRELVELLARHGAEGGKLLSRYEDLASTSSNEGAKYLIDLILEDERRHHRLLAEMANAMAWGSTKRLREAEEADFRDLRPVQEAVAPLRRNHLVGAHHRPHALGHEEARNDPAIPRTVRTDPVTFGPV
jgi:hypothetical protein